MRIETLPGVDDIRVLTVLNPFSSNYPRALAQFAYLRELGYAREDGDFIETSASRHETAQILGDKLTSLPALSDGSEQQYHAVVVLTGDGGGNTIGQSLHDSDDSRIKDMPVVFGKGGGACDLHAMTQGLNEDYLAKLPGQVVRDLCALEVVARTLDGRLERREAAFAHLCIGKLGRVAYDLNGTAHRGSKLLGKPYVHELQEFITTAKSIKPFDRFYMREGTDTDPRLVSDIVITNGNQMGRRVLFPDNIFDPAYHQVIAPSLIGVLAVTGLLFTGDTSSLAPRMESDFYISRRKRGKNTLLQYDGETFALPFEDNNGKAEQLITRVQIGVSDKPLRVATSHTAE